jgi:hypothetical protein
MFVLLSHARLPSPDPRIATEEQMKCKKTAKSVAPDHGGGEAAGEDLTNE